jgi:ketosteroid isomerase-like protein
MPARSDGAALRQHIDKVIEGLRAKDLDALEKLYAPDVVSFDIEPPLQHVGAAAKMKNWLNVFAVFKDLDYEVCDLALTVGDTVAYGHGFGRLSGTLRDGTATPGMWVRVTYCFQKINGTWLIAHDQVSVPLDIPTGKGITTLTP